MGCPMTVGDPKNGNCLLCAAPLVGRRKKWCGDGCADTYWANHAWGVARAAALRRDGWTCVRCGLVGWADVPQHILRVEGRDRQIDPPSACLGDWAVALGMLDQSDLTTLHDWHADSRRWEHVRSVTAELPDTIQALVRSEQRRPRLPTSRPGGHDLEVNHIVPRKGRGYGNGCHHHQDNLETLCRPCHVDETRRQRHSLPSWRHDPRPTDMLLGLGVQGVLV